MADRQGLFGGVFDGRRVFVTGHTGFKGSWLTAWLLELGAQVTGYALEPPTDPSLFEDAGLADRIDHHIADVRDAERLTRTLADARPEVVFHMAAQPLVRLSYDEPVETYATNVMGTVHLLEAVRLASSVRVAVNVTSDKCYENREWEYAYRENDALGGHDPYSSSKACAEIATSAWARSFFGGSEVRLASARAGNVIGGGDWALDRIVPDCVLALREGRSIEVRNPAAVRPWQHVLEPLSGYLWLAARMWESEPGALDGGWNFGPLSRANVTVREVVETLISEWGSGAWHRTEGAGAQPHEARFLKLDCSRAADLLGWQPIYEVDRALSVTAAWYRAHADDRTAASGLTTVDIDGYVAAAREAGAIWTR